MAITPTVEFVLGNGHLLTVVNGRRDEWPEPQQSPFSWAEFLAEEPVAPGKERQAQALVPVPVRASSEELQAAV